MTDTSLTTVRSAAAKAVAASQRRNDLIKQAHAEGSSIRSIAAACGLSAARVHQILHDR
jgi:DNA-directed RNA polymerase specialized sigma24 family protein